MRTNSHTSFHLAVMVLFLTLGVGWWLTLSFVQHTFMRTANSQSNQPDMFMHDVHYLQINEDGIPQNHTSALTVLHHPQDDEYIYTSPELHLVDSSQQIWQITALSGTSKHGQSIITLADQIKILVFTNAATHTPNMEITANTLTAYPDTETAETRDHITITQGGNITDAVGAKLDMKKGILQLLAQVTGKYQDYTPPAIYSAEQAECLQKEHVCTYLGNVKYDQAANHLEAPKVIVYSNDSNAEQKIKKIVAIGKPAYYHTLQEPQKTPVDARAQTIELYPSENLVTLTGAAEVINEQGKFTSEYIKYNTLKHIVFSSASEHSLTTIILNPKTNK